jgi:F-box-like
VLYDVLGQVFHRLTIGSLPDNVLLDIFDFYQNFIIKDSIDEWCWEKLVHVCRRWRYIIFESPIRLNLHLLCTATSPVRELLDVWPPFPLVIRFDYDWSYLIFLNDSEDSEGEDLTDNLIAALERHDRVREIQLHIVNPPNHLCERIVTAMEESFPALRSLSIDSEDDEVLLDRLLNGSAPSLRRLTLSRISFPSLPQLLSSTSDLTYLNLINIPESGYISPETMATSLSALPKLKFLIITFESPTHHPERRTRALPLQTRPVLPTLTYIEFDGVSEYLEVLASRFDVPLLEEFRITFFCQATFDIPQTVRFFAHLDSFKSSSLTLEFNLPRRDYVSISFPSSTTHHFASPTHSWHIKSCSRLDRKLISVTQICSQIPSFRSSVKTLNVKFGDSLTTVQVDPTPWLQLFHSFPFVQSLQIPEALEPFILSALERPTEESLTVFPSLDSLSIVRFGRGESVKQPIQSSFRRRSGRTVAFSRTID